MDIIGQNWIRFENNRKVKYRCSRSDFIVSGRFFDRGTWNYPEERFGRIENPLYFCTTRNRESCCFSSAVEHFLGKEEVPGSSPGNSSKKRGCLTNRRHPLYLFLFVLLSRNHFRICDSRKIKNLPAPLQPHAQCRRHS